MPDAVDPSAICRSDDCRIPGVHRAHLVRAREPKPHHRPKGRESKRNAWELDDPSGLMQSVLRATDNNKPHVIYEIWRDVKDDYGNVSERTVYRYVAKLVEIGRLLHIDLGFTFGVYVQPTARILGEPDAMREIVETTIEYGKGCTGRERYA